MTNESGAVTLDEIVAQIERLIERPEFGIKAMDTVYDDLELVLADVRSLRSPAHPSEAVTLTPEQIADICRRDENYGGPDSLLPLSAQHVRALLRHIGALSAPPEADRPWKEGDSLTMVDGVIRRIPLRAEADKKLPDDLLTYIRLHLEDANDGNYAWERDRARWLAAIASQP